ncbi:MAG: hypothetical protein JWM49_450 [Microbacteriaceae bacterium]|jgi:uncharacterized protein YjbJ (UPF0337 family)|nr:hypothetical protein [Microbacteriaceae bacterium]
MSDTYPPTSVPPSDTGAASDSTTSGRAKEQAAHVAHGAADASKQVAGTVKDQASNVASEAKSQAKNLMDQTRSELRDQAGVQQRRVTDGLHSVSDELQRMASSSENPGLASDLVGQASSRVDGIASWLEARNPGSLLEEVKQFARRRPGTFIAIAAGAGILAGRLTRSVAGGAQDSSPTRQSAAVPEDSTFVGSTDATQTFGPGAAQHPSPTRSDVGAYPSDADFDPSVSADRNRFAEPGS